MKFIPIIFLFILLFVFGIHTLTDINQDIGLHLTTGRIIWQTHNVPETNLFSYTNPDFEFINHHWLGEVLFYLLFLVGGLKGLILFQAFILTGAFALAFFSFYKKESSIVSVVVGIISIFILIDRSLVRPEIFSFLFLAWYLFVLFRKSESKLIWSLPVVQLIWVNTHIYFFLGPLIFLLFLISKFVAKTAGTKRLMLVGVFVALINFVNPFGWNGALYPLFVFKNYGVPILENLSPFKALGFNYPPLSIYTLFFAICFIVISFILNRRNLKNNLFEILLAVASIAFSLVMLRNMPIFALVMLPVASKNFYQSGKIITAKLPQVFTAICILVLILSVIFNKVQGGFNRKFGLIVSDWGQKAVDFVRANNISGPVFNNINTGSFLLWKMPDQKVFIDTRPEAYPADFIRKIFIPMQSDPEKWKFYSEKYGVNYVFYAYNEITPWAQKFLKNMSRDENWPIVYMDKNIVIFLKNTPQNSEIIKKYIIYGRYN